MQIYIRILMNSLDAVEHVALITVHGWILKIKKTGTITLFNIKTAETPKMRILPEHQNLTYN